MHTGIMLIVPLLSATAVCALAVALLWPTIKSRFTPGGRREAERVFAFKMAQTGQSVELPKVWTSKSLSQYRDDSRALSLGFLTYWYVTFLVALAFCKLFDWDADWGHLLQIAAIATVILVPLLMATTEYERYRDTRIIERASVPLHNGVTISADTDGLTLTIGDQTLAGPWSAWTMTDMKFFRARFGITKCWRISVALANDPTRRVDLIDNLIDDDRPLMDLLASRIAWPNALRTDSMPGAFLSVRRQAG